METISEDVLCDCAKFNRRFSLAQSHSTSTGIFEELSFDYNYSIRFALYDNPTTTKQLKAAIKSTWFLKWMACGPDNKRSAYL